MRRAKTGVTPDRPFVFVSLGTDHHPFPRLLEMVSAWAAAHPEIDVVAQSGHTTLPRNTTPVDAVPFVDVEELADLFVGAAVVVCHGGPATIMEARQAGHRPIVVARDPARGEHVDDHQLRFVASLGDRGDIVPAQDGAALGAAIDAGLRAGPPAADAAGGGAVPPAVAVIGNLFDQLIEDHRRVPAERESS